MHGKIFPQEVKELSVPTCENVTDARGRVIHSTVTRSGSLFSLGPFLENNILRVGGRLRRAKLPQDVKHPVILPRKHHVTDLVIRHEHVKLGHAGRNHVLSSLREKYWITGGNSAVRHVIAACVKCRRARYTVQSQKMSDLPQCHVDDTLPPFSYTGIDYFGPFLIKDGRKEVKRYGVILTCLVSIAVHLEIANSLDADSFLHALHRFVARRGNVKRSQRQRHQFCSCGKRTKCRLEGNGRRHSTAIPQGNRRRLDLQSTWSQPHTWFLGTPHTQRSEDSERPIAGTRHTSRPRIFPYTDM